MFPKNKNWLILYLFLSTYSIHFPHLVLSKWFFSSTPSDVLPTQIVLTSSVVQAIQSLKNQCQTSITADDSKRCSYSKRGGSSATSYTTILGQRCMKLDKEDVCFYLDPSCTLLHVWVQLVLIKST